MIVLFPRFDFNNININMVIIYNVPIFVVCYILPKDNRKNIWVTYLRKGVYDKIVSGKRTKTDGRTRVGFPVFSDREWTSKSLRGHRVSTER